MDDFLSTCRDREKAAFWKHVDLTISSDFVYKETSNGRRYIHKPTLKPIGVDFIPLKTLRDIKEQPASDTNNVTEAGLEDEFVAKQRQKRARQKTLGVEKTAAQRLVDSINKKVHEERLATLLSNRAKREREDREAREATKKPKTTEPPKKPPTPPPTEPVKKQADIDYYKRFLHDLHIDSKSDLKTWKRHGHPDKGGNTHLFAMVMNASRSLGWSD